MNEQKKQFPPPGSIGDISLRLGYDVRDLILSGYSDEQIQGVLDGEYTLADLFKMKPAGNLRGRPR
ncbi:MAG: hypothetical protein ACE5FD_16295 [Anaerolineae bacterium]